MINNHNIALPGQDKGDSIVKMPRFGQDGFEEKMEKAIEKENLIETNEYEIDHATRKLQNFVVLYQDQLEGWMDYILPSHYRPFMFGKIKGYIKDHKELTEDQKARLIQTIFGMPTQYIGVFVQKIAKYIKDKYCKKYDIKDVLELCDIFDELNKRNDIDWAKVTLGSLDVVSMFPSYQHDLLSDAFLFYYEDCIDDMPDVIGCKPSMECMKEALTITLKYTLTIYNGKYYKQTNGAPQGGKASCDLADIAHSYVYDEVIVSEIGDKLLCYGKFRDDSIIVSYLQSQNDYKQLIAKLNKINKKIQFTYEFGSFNGKLLNILNITAMLTITGIKRIMLSKLTNHHIFSHPTSCQDSHTNKAVVIGMATLIKMVCSSEFCDDVMEY